MPHVCDRCADPVTSAAHVAAARDRLNARQRLQPAYAALLDAVQACALPFEQGLQRERELFLSLLSTTAAQALRYQFKAETAAVIGACTMCVGVGQGIAVVLERV